MVRDLTVGACGPFTASILNFRNTTGCSMNYHDLSMYYRSINPPESESDIIFFIISAKYYQKTLHGNNVEQNH